MATTVATRHDLLADAHDAQRARAVVATLAGADASLSVTRGDQTEQLPRDLHALLLEVLRAVASGSTHADIARAAAEGTRRSFASTWALAAVGDRDDGTGAIGLIGPDLVTAVPYRSFGDPAIDRSRAAKTALDLLRRRLAAPGR